MLAPCRVLQLLQRHAFVLQLPVQGAHRDVELGGDVLRGVGRCGAGGQQLVDAVHQQAVAPVLQHGQRQGALQHRLQRLLVATHRQREVAGVETDACGVGAEAHRPGEQIGVGVGVGRGGEGEGGLAERDARIHQPAGVAEQVAQRADEAELAQLAQRGVLGDADRRAAALRRARRDQLEDDVVGEQAVVAAPALERDLERGRAQRGAAQHAVAAPRQPAREPAQRLVVERLHRQPGHRLHLGGGDARVGVVEAFGRDLRPLQRAGRIHSPPAVAEDDRADEGDRRGGAAAGEFGGRGGEDLHPEDPRPRGTNCNLDGTRRPCAATKLRRSLGRRRP